MPKTLLLADDSVTIQKVVGISFANEDVRIVTVDNGDDAITRAKEIRPDIVLADVVMPGKSGYDVCAALKADPALAGIPVLLLTGTFETFDEERAARVGADGHITKPFEAQALVELVNSRLASATRPAVLTAATAALTAEPEPFDFLEPPETTLQRPGGGTPRRVRAEADDVFAFDAEPVDLETEDDAEFDLGNEATQARTALLLDDDEAPLAETAPPAAARELDAALAFDDADDVTRLVLPAADASADPDGDIDPLADIEAIAADPFAATPERAAWDVSSDELSDPFSTQVIGNTNPPLDAAAHEAPPVFAEPLFGAEDAGAEFDLNDDGAEGVLNDDGAEVDLNDDAAPAPPAAAFVPARAEAAPAAVAELPDALRDQIHETLEKIAWEALGDVSERIVREAVARIEQVAWDVIPRLAETLIREEIRKLKGEE